MFFTSKQKKHISLTFKKKTRGSKGGVPPKKFRIRETPTLSTDVDSKTNTILRGYVICIIFI